MDIPKHLGHRPIIGVDYEERDSDAGDAKFLSLGHASWASDSDYSAKVFRLANEGKYNQRWSPQSEEIPLWRVLDLATLLVAEIYEVGSCLDEENVGTEKEYYDIHAFLRNNFSIYDSRLKELRRILIEGERKQTE